MQGNRGSGLGSGVRIGIRGLGLGFGGLGLGFGDLGLGFDRLRDRTFCQGSRKPEPSTQRESFSFCGSLFSKALWGACGRETSYFMGFWTRNLVF